MNILFEIIIRRLKNCKSIFYLKFKQKTLCNLKFFVKI